MDPKDTWPVVKFIVAATGFKRRDSRKLLEELPKERYAELFLRARRWEQETASRAAAEWAEVAGGTKLPTLVEASRRAIEASHVQEFDKKPTKPRKKKA